MCLKKSVIIVALITLVCLRITAQEKGTQLDPKSSISITTTLGIGAGATGNKLEGKLTFTWVELKGDFYLEVKNGTTDVFKFDDIWLEGYNLSINGYDKEFKHDYRTLKAIDLDRDIGAIRHVSIAPGKYHRTKVALNDLIKELPKGTTYVDFTLKSNGVFFGGSKLPNGPIKTNIYKTESRTK